MKLLFSLCTLACIVAATEQAARQEPAAAAVLTATRVIHSIIQQSPFLVEATTTVVWTQSPSVTESQPAPTDIPTSLPPGVTVSIPSNLSAILSA